ncbi:MAG TPA: hypothetical protein VIV60_21720 [Polyangiaceae bacterium]
MNEQEHALAEWLRSEDGQYCADWSSLTFPEYLKNRLWWAFNAGYAAGKKSSQIANSENSSDSAGADA